MTLNEIMSLIGTVGFPIVMCVLLWHYISTVQEKIGEIVAKNTEAVNTLVMKLDIIDAINQREKERKENVDKS